MRPMLQAFNALNVIAKDKKIRESLAKSDPKALKQVDNAIAEIQANALSFGDCYRDSRELCPGVYITRAGDLFIRDQHGEVATWTLADVTDAETLINIVCAVACAARVSPEYLRENIRKNGKLIDEMVERTKMDAV